MYPPTISYKLKNIQQDCPTESQLKVLSHITARVMREMNEERNGNIAILNTQDEPIFQVIQGFPGTGKRKVIGWICELFTDILGWERGNQFVCLAVQNTMASNIGCFTIHH